MHENAKLSLLPSTWEQKRKKKGSAREDAELNEAHAEFS